MSVYVRSLPHPVVHDSSDGTGMVNPTKLADFRNVTEANFEVLSHQLHKLTLRAAELSEINKQLIQFMNWLAVTNPQILDEFQNTANAFDKLSPRDSAGHAEACAAAPGV